MSRLRAFLPLSVFALLMALSPQVVAQSESRPVIDVVNMKGLIDPSLSDFVRDAIESAEREGARFWRRPVAASTIAHTELVTIAMAGVLKRGCTSAKRAKKTPSRDIE